MRSVNKVILLGNLAADPELRSTPSGRMVAHFSVATDNQWRDSEGEIQKTTDFHRIVGWNALAKHCAKNLKKGSAVYVEGSLHNRTYEGKDKKKHYVTEITAERVNFIQTKKTTSGDAVVMQDDEEMLDE